ncbi:YhcG family protein [Elusimicrobiota bacterium]
MQKLVSEARRQAGRSVNAVLTITHWEIGRRIIHFEQQGKKRAGYGEEILERLSKDLTKRFSRGFGLSQIKTMRQFYLTYPNPWKRQSAIGQIALSQIRQSLIGELPAKPVIRNLQDIATWSQAFSLSWTHYTLLLRTSSAYARDFYEQEALSGGWSVRQLDRQIGSQFYERTALSKNKTAMLTKGSRKQPGDIMTPEEEIKDPYILEFLNLKDEYSESDLEEALVRHLESFLLELGGDFTFVARQKRLRVGNEWYRVDLVFYHRRLRCLILIDLKLDRFSHADAGQMHLYLNYAHKHWTRTDENPPVGLILCAKKDEMVARYALEGLSNKILASEYKTALPSEKQLSDELIKTKRLIDSRMAIKGRKRKR